MDKINIDLPGKHFSDIEKQFINLRSSGSSIRNIAKTLKKSPTTICDWNKKFSNNILAERNKSYCELQKKVIELKNNRIDFLKEEVMRIIKRLKRSNISEDGVYSEYSVLFERFVKISNILSTYESEILNVGINFKDNISLESDLLLEPKEENNTVIPENNGVTKNTGDKTTEKTNTNIKEEQKCNSGTLPKKYMH